MLESAKHPIMFILVFKNAISFEYPTSQFPFVEITIFKPFLPRPI
jgi:hypothetical protein